METINNKQVKIILDQPYYIGNGIIKFIENGISLGFTHGDIRNKDKKIIGFWKIEKKYINYLHKLYLDNEY